MITDKKILPLKSGSRTEKKQNSGILWKVQLKERWWQRQIKSSSNYSKFKFDFSKSDDENNEIQMKNQSNKVSILQILRAISALFEWHFWVTEYQGFAYNKIWLFLRKSQSTNPSKPLYTKQKACLGSCRGLCSKTNRSLLI